VIFNSSLSKFGKGTNLATIMPSKTEIDIYYFLNCIMKKTISISDQNMQMKKEKTNLPYNFVIPLAENYFVARIDNNIGIVKNEE